MGCCLSSKQAIDPPYDPPMTRSEDAPKPPPQDTPIPPPQDSPNQLRHNPQVITRPLDTPTPLPQATPTPLPQDIPTQPPHDRPSLSTASPGPASEPDVPPPYSALAFQDPKSSTPDPQTLTLFIQNQQTPTPILTTPPPHRSISLTIPATPPTVTESLQLLGPSTVSPSVDLTVSHSTSTSQTPDPTTNPPTLAMSLPQPPDNPVRDERGRSVVQALKATLLLMRATLEKAPSPIPRVQDFLRVTLDVIDLIEISSDEYGLQDIYDLMQEINAQFIVLTNYYSTPEELQRKIDSIARNVNGLVPALSKLVEGRSLEHSRSAGDNHILVADFLRRIKEELDSRANDAADRAPSVSSSPHASKNILGYTARTQTAPSESVPEVRVTLQHGGVSVRIDMQSVSRDAHTSMTIGSTVPRTPSPSSHENGKRVSLPPTIPPLEIHSSHSWDDLPSTVGTTNPQVEAVTDALPNVTV